MCGTYVLHGGSVSETSYYFKNKSFISLQILITGVAGFIGATLAQRLLERGDKVVGIDNLNDYYDVSLKQARLNRCLAHPAFQFRKTGHH